MKRIVNIWKLNERSSVAELETGFPAFLLRCFWLMAPMREFMPLSGRRPGVSRRDATSFPFWSKLFTRSRCLLSEGRKQQPLRAWLVTCQAYVELGMTQKFWRLVAPVPRLARPLGRLTSVPGPSARSLGSDEPSASFIQSLT